MGRLREHSLNGSDEKPCHPPDGDRAMTKIGVCITALFLVGCAPGTDVIYGSSIRPGSGLPSITTMAVGRVGSQPAPAASDTPASPAASASSSPERRGIGIGQPGSGESIAAPARGPL
jgi:hypothetical protein